MSRATSTQVAEAAFTMAQRHFMDTEMEVTLTQTIQYAAIIAQAEMLGQIRIAVDNLTAELGGEDGVLDSIASRISGITEMLYKHG